MKYVFLVVLVVAIPVIIFWYTKDTTNHITIGFSSDSSSTTGVVSENRFPELKQNNEVKITARSDLSTQNPEEGDTVVLTIFDPALIPENSSFMGKPISFFPYEGNIISFIPIPIGKIGNQELTVTFKNGEKMTRTLYVQAKKFPIYNVGIPERLGMTASELIKQLADEKKELDMILSINTKETYFSKPFILPVGNAPVSGTFGEIRKTGSNEIRHLGVDFAPPEGTFVKASNDGIIKKAGFDSIYGNMVIIDHGNEVFSMYLHMKSVSVRVGDAVKQGETIGVVGNTGYSTGEHLHFSIKINSISVDPLRFISVLK